MKKDWTEFQKKYRLENCNKFKEVFLDIELGFTSNCKKLNLQN